VRIVADAQTNDLIPATAIENVAVPSEHSNAAPGTDSTKL
jgi:hypothetical protein